MSSGDHIRVRRAAALAFAITSTLAGARAGYAQTPAASTARDTQIIDVVIVTAQRREENLIDVPIAVAAFSGEALERRQIDQATDLQLNVPNVSYTKTNFTGSNFQIRGIGVSSVAASGDSGVETHFNSMPIKNPRLFETEYFDVQRVEVLRGPQGTLYGRNATGGAVNIIARRPEKEFEGNVELEAGNYGAVKVKGMVNIPLGETVAARFAGISFKRDGYTDNLATGNDIDGRDQWSARGALRFTPSDRADVTLMINHYKEDSNRSRVTKQMCHHDPNGALGCLPDRLAFEAGNMRGTLGGILGEWGPLLLDLGDGTPDGSFAGFPLPPALINTGTDVNTGSPVPRDLHKTFAEYDPIYRADETVGTLEFSYDFGPMTLTTVAGYQETSFLSQTDYNWTIAGLAYDGPAVPAFGGAIPISEIDGPLLGSLAGSVRDAGVFSRNYDQSDQEADQWSAEVRLSSELEGPVEFPDRRVLFRHRRQHQLLRRDQRARLLGAGDGAVHAVPELGAAVLHQCHAERVAEVDRGIRRAVLGRDRDAQVDRRPALHARRKGCAGSADAVLGAGGHAADRDGVQRVPRRRDDLQRVHGPLRLRLEAGLVRGLDSLRVLLARLQGRRLQSAARPEPAAVRGNARGLRSGVRQCLRGRLEEHAGRRPRAGEPHGVLLPVRRVAGVEDRRAHFGQRERGCEHLRAGRRVRVQPGETTC